MEAGETLNSNFPELVLEFDIPQKTKKRVAKKKTNDDQNTVIATEITSINPVPPIRDPLFFSSYTPQTPISNFSSPIQIEEKSTLPGESVWSPIVETNPVTLIEPFSLPVVENNPINNPISIPKKNSWMRTTRVDVQNSSPIPVVEPQIEPIKYSETKNDLTTLAKSPRRSGGTSSSNLSNETFLAKSPRRSGGASSPNLLHETSLAKSPRRSGGSSNYSWTPPEVSTTWTPPEITPELPKTWEAPTLIEKKDKEILTFFEQEEKIERPKSPRINVASITEERPISPRLNLADLNLGNVEFDSDSLDYDSTFKFDTDFVVPMKNPPSIRSYTNSPVPISVPTPIPVSVPTPIPVSIPVETTFINEIKQPIASTWKIKSPHVAEPEIIVPMPTNFVMPTTLAVQINKINSESKKNVPSILSRYRNKSIPKYTTQFTSDIPISNNFNFQQNELFPTGTGYSNRIKLSHTPNFSAMDESTRIYTSIRYRSKLLAYADAHPEMKIRADWVNTASLENMHSALAAISDTAQVQHKQDTYRYIFIAIVILVEVLMTKILGLPAKGFAKTQIYLVHSNYYDSLLAELAEKHSITGISSTPIEWRLFTTIGLSVLLYIALIALGQYFGTRFFSSEIINNIFPKIIEFFSPAAPRSSGIEPPGMPSERFAGESTINRGLDKLDELMSNFESIKDFIPGMMGKNASVDDEEDTDDEDYVEQNKNKKRGRASVPTL